MLLIHTKNSEYDRRPLRRRPIYSEEEIKTIQQDVEWVRSELAKEYEALTLQESPDASSQPIEASSASVQDTIQRRTTLHSGSEGTGTPSPGRLRGEHIRDSVADLRDIIQRFAQHSNNTNNNAHNTGSNGEGAGVVGQGPHTIFEEEEHEEPVRKAPLAYKDSLSRLSAECGWSAQQVAGAADALVSESPLDNNSNNTQLIVSDLMDTSMDSLPVVGADARSSAATSAATTPSASDLSGAPAHGLGPHMASLATESQPQPPVARGIEDAHPHHGAYLVSSDHTPPIPRRLSLQPTRPRSGSPSVQTDSIPRRHSLQAKRSGQPASIDSVSYTHLRAHET